MKYITVSFLAFLFFCGNLLCYAQQSKSGNSTVKSLKLSGTLATLEGILKASDVKYDLTKREPRRIEIPYSTKDYTAYLSASMETARIFAIMGVIVPDSKKYKFSDAELMKIATFFNNNTRLSKYTYSIRDNALIFAFRQFECGGQSIPVKELSILYAIAKNELLSTMLTLRFVKEDAMTLEDAYTLVCGLECSKLPLEFSYVKKYPQKAMGYSIKFFGKNTTFEEYRYNIDKKWAFNSDEFKAHFKELSQSLSKVSGYSDVKSISVGHERIGGVDFMKETFTIKHKGKDCESVIYLGVKNPDVLVKFRVTYDSLPVPKETLDAVKWTISERLKSKY